MMCFWHWQGRCSQPALSALHSQHAAMCSHWHSLQLGNAIILSEVPVHYGIDKSHNATHE